MAVSVGKPWHPCCFIAENGEGCKQPAEWEIYVQGGQPYSGLLACSEHVGALLTEDEEHLVLPHVIKEKHAQAPSQMVHRRGGTAEIFKALCGKESFDGDSVTRYESLINCPDCLRLIEELKVGVTVGPHSRETPPSRGDHRL